MIVTSTNGKTTEINLAEEDILSAWQIAMHYKQFDVLRFVDSESGDVHMFMSDKLSSVTFDKKERDTAIRLQQEEKDKARREFDEANEAATE